MKLMIPGSGSLQLMRRALVVLTLATFCSSLSPYSLGVHAHGPRKLRESDFKIFAPSEPQQIHISLGSDPSQMTIQWVTFQDGQSLVKYGTQPGALGYSAVGSTSSYSQSGWNGIIHAATLIGLKPATRYFYVCGDGNSWSAQYSFVTLPAADSQGAIDVAVFGDMGLDYESDATVAALSTGIATQKFKFLIHMGDIAYTYGGGITNQTRLDAFMNKIQPLAANAPYMVSPGNQEFPYGFIAFEKRWAMPGAASGSGTNLWYSYNVGPMHYVSISTEHLLKDGSPQRAWLDADLQKANNNRDKQPWIVVYGHRPAYCSNAPTSYSWWADCYIVGVGLRDILEPLFAKYGVDVYFAGHMHDAEYTFPVYQGKITSTSYNNPPSTVHIISGYAGSREGFNGFSDDYKEPWSVWRQAEHYGYGHMTYNTTHLHFRFMYSSDNAVHQELTIVRNGPRTMNHAFSHATTKKKVELLQLSGDDMIDFLKGFGIGLGIEFGNIAECVADAYPLAYLFNVSFAQLDEGFAKWNLTRIVEGFRTFGAAMEALNELLEDCGGYEGAADFLQIIEQFEKYGIIGVGEEEVMKVIKHYSELSNLIQLGLRYWKLGLYAQSGAQWGQVVGIMIRPL